MMNKSHETDLYNEVFVSYSRQNKGFAQKIVHAIYERGRERVWVDWEDIEYAEDWWQRIQNGIDSAENFIFILTPDSVNSKVCHDEIEYAVNAGKRIIPIEHISVNDKVHFDKMHPQISAHNWLPFKENDDFDAGMDKLIQTIETDLKHTKLHTRFTVRARDWETADRNSSFLFTGDEIDSAEAWLEVADANNKTPAPIQLHRDYISASRERDTKEKRRVRRLRWLGIGSSILFVLATIALGTLLWFVRSTLDFFFNERDNTITQVEDLRRLEENIPVIMNSSQFVQASQLATDETTAELLAIRALQEANIPLAQQQLLSFRDEQRLDVIEATNGDYRDFVILTNGNILTWTVDNIYELNPQGEIVQQFIPRNIQPSFINGVIERPNGDIVAIAIIFNNDLSGSYVIIWNEDGIVINEILVGGIGFPYITVNRALTNSAPNTRWHMYDLDALYSLENTENLDDFQINVVSLPIGNVPDNGEIDFIPLSSGGFILKADDKVYFRDADGNTLEALNNNNLILHDIIELSNQNLIASVSEQGNQGRSYVLLLDQDGQQLVQQQIDSLSTNLLALENGNSLVVTEQTAYRFSAEGEIIDETETPENFGSLSILLPNGQFVTQDEDGILSVWSPEFERIGELAGQLFTAHIPVQYSLSDGQIVTINRFGELQISPPITREQLIAEACAQVNRDFTEEERELYNLDDTATCPHVDSD